MTNGILTFKFQPGTQSSYSGEGFFYVARFAQNKAGQPFDRLAQNYVLGPIGMKDTSFTSQTWFNGRPAQPSRMAHSLSRRLLPPGTLPIWSKRPLPTTPFRRRSDAQRRLKPSHRGAAPRYNARLDHGRRT